MKYIICHYGEIALKGKNRPFFENKLVKNIKKTLNKEKIDFVKRIFGRIIIKLNKRVEKEESEKFKNIFGVANFSPAVKVKQNIEAIQKEALNLLEKEDFKTFRITTKRAQKDFPLNSQEINEKVGAAVCKKLNKEVDLDNPDITCFIEIVQDLAFVYIKKIWLKNFKRKILQQFVVFVKILIIFMI